MDDDLMVMHPFQYNLVQHFDRHEIAVAYRNKIFEDIPEVVTGLPELARYWMVTHNMSVPLGSLFEHLQPPTIDGLSSVGWDRHTFQASFLVINTDFWFEDAMQDFVNLALNTGGDLLQRWGEQGVINMALLLLLEPRHILLLPQLSLVHEKVHDPRMFRLLHCDFVDHAEPLSADVDVSVDVLPAGVSEVDVLLTWYNPGIKPVATERLRELFLFHWVYNASAASTSNVHGDLCGADTVGLNAYQQYVAEAEERGLRRYHWWHQYEVEAKLEALLDQRGHHAESVAQCRAVLRRQLEEFANFYCSYTGIHFGRPMDEHCSGIQEKVLQMFDAQG
jgi:hypothetical protein